MAPHPPVLIVPDVLSPDDCRQLINVYETRGQTFMPPGAGIDYIGTDYKMRIPEHGRTDRIDHWIVDKETETFLHRRIELRVLPEISKAFQYRITRWERLRIGCYQGQRGGKLHGHRDNVEPTPYRRFAMSIPLPCGCRTASTPRVRVSAARSARPRGTRTSSRKEIT